MRPSRILLTLLCLILPLTWDLSLFAETFYQQGGEIYDSWHISRTRPQGEDGFFQVSQKGFRPIIAFESLGRNAGVTYRVGQEFLHRFPDPFERAERIYRFVRDSVRYTHDIDRFGYPEFAQNADELARKIESGRAYGDCEDYAILLATMYKAAGHRSAIALVPGHAAALVYLPGYRKASVSFELNYQPGWVWAEATGRNNPLGWCPSQAMRGDILAYEISTIEDLTPKVEPKGQVIRIKEREASRGRRGVPLFSTSLIMWVIPSIGRLFMVLARGRKRG
jgi:hypothetical protein